METQDIGENERQLANYLISIIKWALWVNAVRSIVRREQPLDCAHFVKNYVNQRLIQEINLNKNLTFWSVNDTLIINEDKQYSVNKDILNTITNVTN